MNRRDLFARLAGACAALALPWRKKPEPAPEFDGVQLEYVADLEHASPRYIRLTYASFREAERRIMLRGASHQADLLWTGSGPG